MPNPYLYAAVLGGIGLQLMAAAPCLVFSTCWETRRNSMELWDVVFAGALLS